MLLGRQRRKVRSRLASRAAAGRMGAGTGGPRVAPLLRQMKSQPKFRFQPDTSFDNFAKIDALLRSEAVARDLTIPDDSDLNN